MIDLKILNESYQRTKEAQGEMSRLEFLGDYIFGFTTYDSDMAELFSTKALEVCKALSQNNTFEYIKDKENYRWYLLMVNMRFFEDRMDWASSIRGARWNYGSQLFETCSIFVDGEQRIQWTMTESEWLQFIDALIEFGLGAPT